uniref:FAD/NAD(P)-binding oxidoreductase family protein n=1 Tax=Tanacetum cinerariifolium TaxID=118510 RepID=A0A6L2JQ92_TANCI|nr:FAD/NAD(P)-binding oxidoreductase family protein [Tanacetum cinerariifolium]
MFSPSIKLISSFTQNPNHKFKFTPKTPLVQSQKPIIQCAKKGSSSKRTGKSRYPSEKRKLKGILQQLEMNEDEKFKGFWRFFKLGVLVGNDPGKDFVHVGEGLLVEIAKVLEFPVPSMLPPEAFTVLRKSFDARKSQKEPKFVYTVEMDVDKLLNLEPRTYDFISRLEPKIGVIEHTPYERIVGDLVKVVNDNKKIEHDNVPGENGHSGSLGSHNKPKIAVVGSGPAGLFASLVLAEFGVDVTLIERGQPVEKRGRDIGALVVRKILQSESNFCFGEGGAGTWSDGKLVTRIGRNSGSVLSVMKTLVRFGAPESILVDGKPHLGTDRLIPLLRNFRQHLQEIGVNIRFGTRVDDLIVENGHVVGVNVSDSSGSSQFNNEKLGFDAVVLAVGHSARDVYQTLLSHNVELVPKDFAVGLRVEHPQELINSIQYSKLANEVRSGRGKIPVADYKVVEYVEGEGNDTQFTSKRSCYSFCMCPGGQVVVTSIDPSELCINGMSFSRRASKWANAALAVTVSPKDFQALGFHGPLAGVQFQREFEQRAATMGSGNFVVPVQTVKDFMDNTLSATTLPSSSYRLGVKAANLHELFPVHITEALQHSLSTFDLELPGFISHDALLHGVETRTSSPVQIPRNPDTFESGSLGGLYPVGEGAGYAGGIVSAAVDGMYAGFALAKRLDLYKGDIESIFGRTQNSGSAKY